MRTSPLFLGFAALAASLVATACGNTDSVVGTSSEPIGGRHCSLDSQCPTIDADCLNCSRDLVACPSYQCLAGRCVALTPTCNDSPCDNDTSCPEVDADCLTCENGAVLCPEYQCLANRCVVGQPICASSR